MVILCVGCLGALHRPPPTIRPNGFYYASFVLCRAGARLKAGSRTARSEAGSAAAIAIVAVEAAAATAAIARAIRAKVSARTAAEAAVVVSARTTAEAAVRALETARAAAEFVAAPEATLRTAAAGATTTAEASGRSAEAAAPYAAAARTLIAPALRPALRYFDAQLARAKDFGAIQNVARLFGIVSRLEFDERETRWVERHPDIVQFAELIEFGFQIFFLHFFAQVSNVNASSTVLDHFVFRSL